MENNRVFYIAKAHIALEGTLLKPLPAAWQRTDRAHTGSCLRQLFIDGRKWLGPDKASAEQTRL